jgi:hypothetical protein
MSTAGGTSAPAGDGDPEGRDRVTNRGVFVLSEVGTVNFRKQTTESMSSKFIWLPDDKNFFLENVSGEFTDITAWG